MTDWPELYDGYFRIPDGIRERMVPCPFCGSSNLAVGINDPMDHRSAAWVECLSCHASGPTHRRTRSMTNVLSAWDGRGEVDG